MMEYQARSHIWSEQERSLSDLRVALAEAIAVKACTRMIKVVSFCHKDTTDKSMYIRSG